MPIRASALFDEFKERNILSGFRGDDALLERVTAATHCGPGALVFVDRAEFVAAVCERGAAGVITTPELADAFAGLAGGAVMTTPDLKLARALVIQAHFDRDLRPEDEPRIHPSAVVHSTATVDPSARIGAHAFVGARAAIGPDAVLLTGVVVEDGARIGARTVLHPKVVVGYDCVLGDDVIVRAGTILGSEGFGFAQDQQRKSHRIPQLGNVVIEDRVVVGANCCIDRGTHGATRIASGTVLDNLCHIAHNVEIGEDCILTAMLCVAGSTKIGKRVITSGQTGIIDHRVIGDDVVLLHRAGVATDVTEAGAYAGVPLMPLREHVKREGSIRRLAGMREALRALEARIEALEKGGG